MADNPYEANPECEQEPAPIATNTGLFYPGGSAFEGVAHHPWEPMPITITW